MVVRDVPDFGTGDKIPDPIEFKIDGDSYYAVGETSMGVLFDMADLVKTEGLSNQIDALVSFIQSVLMPESYERLKARLRDSKRPPVSFQVLMNVLNWVMEQQADRPTQQSSSSPASPGATIGISTAGAPLGA